MARRCREECGTVLEGTLSFGFKTIVFTFSFLSMTVQGRIWDSLKRNVDFFVLKRLYLLSFFPITVKRSTNKQKEKYYQYIVLILNNPTVGIT